MATVLITANPTVENTILALRLGVNDYLTKPFKFHELKRAVVQALNAWQSEMENKEFLNHLKESNITLDFYKHKLTNKIEVASQNLYESNKKLRERINELSTINEISKAITAVLDMEELLELCIKLINDRLQVSHSSVMLLDNAGELVVKAAKGLRCEQIIGLRQKVGEGIAGWVASHREPVLVRNVDTDSRFTPRNYLPYRTKSFVSSPLLINKQLLGVINVADKLSGEEFTESDVSLLTTLAASISIAIENARLYKSLEENCFNTVKALATSLEAKCSYTSGHSIRVADYALKVADKLNLPKKEKDMLLYATQLHDIGKIGIPDDILNKPDRLTSDEFGTIKQHPITGEKILESLSFLKDIGHFIRNHHEHWDGSGYPDGLKGEEIPLLTRIVTIADAFDAMTSDRTYRPAKAKEDALLELNKSAGRQFDPVIVDAFICSRDF